MRSPSRDRDTERDTHTEGQRQREKKDRDRQTDRQRERDRGRDREKSQRDRDRRRERAVARKNMLGTYYATKCTRLHGMKQPAIQSNKDIHNTQSNHIFAQSLIAHRATGSSSIVVYSKQYRISV